MMMAGDGPSDDRFEIIAEAKRRLLECTNIGSVPDEMKVIDSILFRCWQMGWLGGRTDKKDDATSVVSKVAGLEKRVSDIEGRLERMAERIFVIDGRTAPLMVVGRPAESLPPFGDPPA